MSETGSTVWMVHIVHRHAGQETRVFDTEEQARQAMTDAIAELCDEHASPPVGASEVALLDYLREFGEGAWIEQSTVR